MAGHRSKPSGSVQSTSPRASFDSSLPAVKPDHIAFSTARRGRASSQSSLGAFDSDTDFDAGGDGDGSRRRKTPKPENGSSTGKEKKPRPANAMSSSHQSKPRKPEGHDSDFSSNSTSEDVELDDMLSEEDISDDDEETGLTRSDRKSRRRLRKRTTDLDSRIGGSGEDRKSVV